jgi:type VI secretion system secreted protein VgrG
MSMSVVARPELYFHTGALDSGAFRLVRMHGFEAIGHLYEFELELELHDDEPLDLESVESVLRAPALLGFAEEGTLEHPWHGILREMELFDAHEGHAPRYRAVMVPSLWYLTQTVRTRIFLEKSVPEIVRTVLGDHGFRVGEHYEMSLRDSYATREYVLQYAESDYDFIARLFEHEGIFFFFDQRPDGEVMIVGDNNAVFDLLEGRRTIPFDPRDAVTVAGGAIHRVSRRYCVVPQHLVMREYHPDQPRSPRQTDAVIHDRGFGLVMMHGQNALDDNEQKRLSTVRAEERAIDRHMHQAVSSVRGLRCGHRFQLEGHTFGELVDAELAVVAIRHAATPGLRGAGEAGEPYGSELDLVPVGVPFRTHRSTPRPRIDGVIHAKIDGEMPGVPAPLDEEGRYKVLLPFDVAGEVGGRASTWMRMTQAFSGPAYGMHFPLHVGADVLVAHVEGDPDRPVLLGALPTPEALSPVVRDNATQAVVRSKANIVIELEDDA